MTNHSPPSNILWTFYLSIPANQPREHTTEFGTFLWTNFRYGMENESKSFGQLMEMNDWTVSIVFGQFSEWQVWTTYGQ